MKTRWNSIEQLPDDFTTKELSPRVDLKDLNRLIRVSKRVCTLFATPFLLRKQETLLKHVSNGDYDRVEKIISYEPELMFAGSLQHTFKVRDGHMYFLLLKIIKEKNDPTLLEKFNKQKQQAALIESINLSPLFQAYDDCIDQCERFLKHQINKNEMDNAWLNLGRAQRQYFPCWMLKLICDDKTWIDISKTFYANSERPLSNGRIRAFYKGKDGRKEKFNIEKLGKDFSIVVNVLRRVSTFEYCRVAGAVDKPIYSPDFLIWLNEDVRNLRGLWKIRTNEFREINKCSESLEYKNTSCLIQ